jgi:hypothetical protein
MSKEGKSMSRFATWTKRERRLALACGAATVVAVGLGVGFGVSALSSSPSTQAAASTSSPTTPTTTVPAATGKPRHQGVRGQITAESGNTWTVLNKAGKTFTVDITSSTQFGSKASPASQSTFVVGSPVAAQGSRAGTTVTALRILTPKQGATTTPGSTTTSG